MRPAGWYVERAMEYAQGVVSGAIVACHWVRQACQRQLSDLERVGSDGWEWEFDAERAEAPCRFIELMPHIKGKWAREGRRIEMEPWQIFIVVVAFGWVHAQSRLRRYTEAYIEVARKNAKSTLTAGLCLYMLAADGEAGAEVYTAATTRDQARIVFDDARAMAQREPEMRAELGVDVQQHVLLVPDTASKLAPLSAEGSTLDGLNIHFACVDELHAHKTRAVYDVLDTARGAREQPLLWNITTAGTDRSGICYERRTHITKVLDGLVDDPRQFGIIYTLDEGDDWQDEAVWCKANPNWQVSVFPDVLRTACRKAQAMPSALANFLTKHLNVWVSSSVAWMDMPAWGRLGDSSLEVEQFAGRRAWIGMDLAEKRDFAALAVVIEDGDRWVSFSRLYLNERAIEQSGNAMLDGWAREGHIIVTPGQVTDLDMVAQDLRDLCQLLDVQEVPFDPALSRYFATRLVEEGLPLVEIRQAPLFWTQPLIQLENLVLEERFAHDDNPCFAWMVSNVEVTTSKYNGLKQPTKAREENKIDGPIALFMALGRALEPADEEEPSPMVYVLGAP